MKILALIGSLRQGSYNRIIFENYKKLLDPRVEISEGIISDFPFYNEEVKEAGIPAVVSRVAEQIQTSDIVLIFSPEYNYSIPGVLKNAVDWLSKAQPQPFIGKKVSILSASPGKLGGARMQYHLRQVGVSLDMQILNRPEVMISEVHKKINAQGELTDEDTKKFLKSHIDQLMKLS